VDQLESIPLVPLVDLGTYDYSSDKNPTVGSSPPRKAKMFSMPRSFASWKAILRCRVRNDTNQKRTLSASLTIPCSILVHVRCINVSTACSVCVKPASSRLRSFVVPPAPHVTLIANGLSAQRREMRENRFSNPYRDTQSGEMMR
jgi:hypothetical protein